MLARLGFLVLAFDTKSLLRCRIVNIMAQYQGVIKSFGAQKGYGFISSQQYSGDVFFGKKDLPPEFQQFNLSFDNFQLKGKPVLFELATQDDGKQFATRIQLRNDGDSSIVGIVKSYNSLKGWGFLTTSSIDGKDIFFSKRDVPLGFKDSSNLVGQACCFVVSTVKGQMQATNLKFGTAPSASTGLLQQLQMQLGGNGLAALGGLAQVPNLQQLLMQQATNGLEDGQGMQGTVKFYNTTKGYGFIKCAKIPTDLYFKDSKNLDLTQDMTVAFTLRIMPDGTPQAHDVSIGLEDGQSCMGTVRWYNGSKGFGFIAVPGNPADIYFKKDLVPVDLQGSQIHGKTVEFIVRVNQDGKPHMQSGTFLDDPPAGYTPPPLERKQKATVPVGLGMQLPLASFGLGGKGMGKMGGKAMMPMIGGGGLMHPGNAFVGGGFR